MKDLEKVYRKNKSIVLPVIFVLVSLFAIFRILIPLVDDILKTQKAISEKMQTLAAKKESIRVLNSISDDSISSDFELVTTALPLQKNFVLIFDELNRIADSTNVELGGFSVNIGGIYSTGGIEVPAEESVPKIEGVPYLNTLITVSGPNQNLKNFAEKMYKSIPLIEINKIDIAKNDAKYDVNFFYKPVALRSNEGVLTALTGLNDKERKQLESLRTWLK